MFGHFFGTKKLGMWLLLALGLVAVAACGSSEDATATSAVSTSPTTTTPSSGTPTSVPSTTPTAMSIPSADRLDGAGATFPFPLYSKWFDEYNTLTGVEINYQSIGSGGGVKAITEQTVDFGASDGILSDSEQSAAEDAGGPLLHIPMTMGSVAVVYNLPGLTTSGEADVADRLDGAGATFPFPLYSKWFDEYNTLTGVEINYQSIGSGGGVKAITEKTVDFGASDGILSDSEQAAAEAAGGPLLHIPMTMGSVAVVYNLPGVASGALKLTPDVLADIYLKNITKWNDSSITALNPGVNLPDTDITVVHRSDGSGTTFIFTNYLSKVSSEWESEVGNAKSVDWPGDVGGQGNEGVAGQVTQLPGAIGYVELAYAEQNDIPWVALGNASGNYVEPSIEGTSLSADGVTLPDDLKIMVTNSDNPDAYPISGFTWILAYKNQTDCAQGRALVDMLWWALHDGQQYANSLLYAPLPPDAITKAAAEVRSMTCNGQPLLAETDKVKLSADVLADIYLKKITKWNDSRIMDLNPGVNLPGTDITVVHRSDGSGTTFIFTNYLSKVSSEWESEVGNAKSVDWPGDVGGQGNEGVAGQVTQLPGAIGYVELAYAEQNGIPWIALGNSSGNFIEPSITGTTLSASGVSLPDDMKIMVTNSGNPEAYPISGFTWILAYQEQEDCARGKALVDMLWWAIHDGQQYATPLQYAPLPPDAVTKAEVEVNSITCNGEKLR